jgi:hypothetical protein
MSFIGNIYRSGRLPAMKRFWTAYAVYYARHKKALLVNICYCLLAGLIMGLITKKFPYLFFVGYIISDPVSYYVYRFRQLTNEEREAVNCDHEVLDDSKPHRCKHCGLNESFW